MTVTSEDVPAAPRPVPALARPAQLDAGPGDLAELGRLLRAGVRAGNEQSGDAARLDEVIPKPWGYEYRAFRDHFFDAWCLHIEPGHSTSMHAHPRKLTYLICLAGHGATSGLACQAGVVPGAMVRIAPGAFHATRNSGGETLVLTEVEVPRNKLDLLRLADDYDRAGTGYETGSRAVPDLPMRPVRHRPHTRMRDRTLDGRFRFALRTGMDLFYRPQPADICYIPLCLSGALRREVHIIPGGQRPDTALTYLCITRAG